MKVTFAIWCRDSGDGSSYPMIFKNKPAAVIAAEESGDGNYYDSISEVTIEVDKTGRLV